MTFVAWYMILGLFFKLWEAIITPLSIGLPVSTTIIDVPYCIEKFISFGIHVVFCFYIWSNL